MMVGKPWRAPSPDRREGWGEGVTRLLRDRNPHPNRLPKGEGTLHQARSGIPPAPLLRNPRQIRNARDGFVFPFAKTLD